MSTDLVPRTRSGRRRPPRGASGRRGWLLVLGVAGLAAVGAVAFLLTGGSDPNKSGAVGVSVPARRAARASHRSRVAQRTILVRAHSGDLPAAVQDAAAAPEKSGEMVLLGGLTASDLSTNAILGVDGHQVEREGKLPAAVHD